MFKKWLAGFLIAMMVVQPLGVMADTISVSEDAIAEDTVIEDNAGSSISNIANPRIVPDSSMTAGQKVTYDCIWFGSYPQAEVVASKSSYTAIPSDVLKDGDLIEDASLYSQLENASYSNNETTIDGTRYRRMSRNNAAFEGYGRDNEYNWGNIYYHYFKYEPIKWRVIETDSNTVFLLADKCIDGYDYNKGSLPKTWETCTLRSYLNNSFYDNAFYDNAFNTTEKELIIKSTVENANNLYYETKGGNDTSDNVFLLSEKEVYKTNNGKSFTDSSAAVHGFVDSDRTGDEARRARSTTFSKAMGGWWSISGSNKGNCYWWLRSPGKSLFNAVYVLPDGKITGEGGDVHYCVWSVRPALKIHLSSLTDSMYAGTVCSDGTVYETAKPGDGGGSSDKPSVNYSSIYPQNGSTSMALGENIELVFDGDISPVGNLCDGIRIMDYKTDAEISTKYYIYKNKLIVMPQNDYLDGIKTYYLKVPKGCIETANGSNQELGKGDYSFTTTGGTSSLNIDNITYMAMVSLAYEIDPINASVNHKKNKFGDMNGVEISNLYNKEIYVEKVKEFGTEKISETKYLGNEFLDGDNDSDYLDDGLTKKDLYEDQLKEWKFGSFYQDIDTGIFAFTLLNVNCKQVVVIYGGSNGMYVELDNIESITSGRVAGGKDWGENDFPIYLTNKEVPQMRKALEFFADIKEKYSGYNISITGHSLGSGLGTLVSTAYDVKAVTFDSIPMLDVSYYRMPRFMSENFFGKNEWKQLDIINEGDFLAGTWEADYKNALSAPNLYRKNGPFNHASEALIGYENGHFYLSSDKNAILNTPKEEWIKNMWLQELDLKADQGFGWDCAAGFLEFITKRLSLNNSNINNWVILGNSWEDNLYGVSRLSSDSIMKRMKVGAYSGVLIKDVEKIIKNLPIVPENNTIYGGDGSDNIVGHSGNDIIIPGSGNDHVDGALGNDTYIVWKNQDWVEIKDGQGSDTIEVHGIEKGDKYGIGYEGKDNYIYVNDNIIVSINTSRLVGSKFDIKFFDGNENIIDNREIKHELFKNYSKYNFCTVACPVKLEIYDASGDLVKTITDESEPTEYEEYGYFYNILQENGEYEKSALLFDTSYTVKTVAVGQGTMDILMDEVNMDGEIVRYHADDVELKENEVFDVDFDRKSFVDNEQSRVVSLKNDSGLSGSITKDLGSGYSVVYSDSVIFNGMSHIEEGGKANKTKYADVSVKLYGQDGKEIDSSKYVVKFKNNKDTNLKNNKQPSFTIKLKGKDWNRDTKKYLADKLKLPINFDIKPMDIAATKAIAQKVTCDNKGAWKISGLCYYTSTGKKITLKPANAKGVGDYKIKQVTDNSIIIEGIQNYTGQMEIKK